jgi:hypothetical protein
MTLCGEAPRNTSAERVPHKNGSHLLSHLFSKLEVALEFSFPLALGRNDKQHGQKDGPQEHPHDEWVSDRVEHGRWMAL